MYTTVVCNLATGAEITYVNEFTAEQNARNAYMYGKGDKNWWTYKDVPVTVGMWTVACGDWCAIGRKGC